MPLMKGWCYVGETGRCFGTKKKEHIRNVKNCASSLNIWSDGHCIDFENSHVIEKH